MGLTQAGVIHHKLTINVDVKRFIPDELMEVVKAMFYLL